MGEFEQEGREIKNKRKKENSQYLALSVLDGNFASTDLLATPE